MYYSIVLSLAFSGLVLQLQFSCSESILELRMSGSVACNIGKDRKIDVGGHGSRFFGPNHPFHLFKFESVHHPIWGEWRHDTNSALWI